jgi:preprotein translocase subunit SecD
MTSDNIGNQVAIVLDNKVHSAPTVNEPIPNGRLNLSGGFEGIQAAKNFCNILSLNAVLPNAMVLIEEPVYTD